MSNENVSEFKRKPNKEVVPTFYEDLSEVINKHAGGLSLATVIGTIELIKMEIVSNQINKELN